MVTMRHREWLAPGLAVAAVVSCLAAGVWMSATPMMNPTVAEIGGMISVPSAIAAAATWAAWTRRRLVLTVLTAALGAFAFVTGFSIGGAFLPAFGLLVWATVATFENNQS